MSEPKYFFAENCHRRFLTPNNRRIIFEDIDHFGGTWRGVFKAEQAEDIEALSALAAAQRTGVREITQAEYDAQIEKKTPTSNDFNPLHLQANPNPVPASNQVALTGPGAPVVESSSSAVEEAPPVDGAPVEADAVLTPSVVSETAQAIQRK